MTTLQTTPVAEIANDLVEKCRQGKNMEVIETHYSPDIVSIESKGSPEMPQEMTGIEAIKQKNQWWLENHEIHKAEVQGPFIGDTQFSVHFNYEVTFKPTGQRTEMTEMALYTVENKKIVKEQFFYNPAGCSG